MSKKLLSHEMVKLLEEVLTAELGILPDKPCSAEETKGTILSALRIIHDLLWPISHFIEHANNVPNYEENGIIPCGEAHTSEISWRLSLGFHQGDMEELAPQRYRPSVRLELNFLNRCCIIYEGNAVTGEMFYEDWSDGAACQPVDMNVVNATIERYAITAGELISLVFAIMVAATVADEKFHRQLEAVVEDNEMAQAMLASGLDAAGALILLANADRYLATLMVGIGGNLKEIAENLTAVKTVSGQRKDEVLRLLTKALMLVSLGVIADSNEGPVAENSDT